MGLPEDLSTYKPRDALDLLETAREIFIALAAVAIILGAVYAVLIAALS